MKCIPIYCDNLWFGGFDGPWSIRQWLVSDGASIDIGQQIAEAESELCIAGVASSYTGLLRHHIPAGAGFCRGTPIAYVECSAAQYEKYLKEGGRMEVAINLSPEELDLLESRRGDRSRETFVMDVLRKELHRPA